MKENELFLQSSKYQWDLRRNGDDGRTGFVRSALFHAWWQTGADHDHHVDHDEAADGRQDAQRATGKEESTNKPWNSFIFLWTSKTCFMFISTSNETDKNIPRETYL